MPESLPQPEQPRSPAKTFFGYFLAIVGCFIACTAGLCGACSLVVFFTNLDEELILTILLFSGGPLIVGVGMFYGGRAILRSNGDIQGKEDDDGWNQAP